MRSIFRETPDFAEQLDRQLESAEAISRENTGGGFFTSISVKGSLPVITPRTLGETTHARVGGMEHGLGFVLFMQNGWLHTLEGFSLGGEETAQIDFSNVQFEIYHQTVSRLG